MKFRNIDGKNAKEAREALMKTVQLSVVNQIEKIEDAKAA